ncbi:hypothetical protein N7454_008772 [Penicillium verhagenii]|nr:hypothetical protein N7454_008772 [Penicillium verhagenii]
MARTAMSSNLVDREGAISIAFQTAEDREEFMGVLQGRPVSSTYSSLSG